MVIMYLSCENFTCPAKKEHSLALALLISCINSLKDINSIKNSVDPDQLASDEAS